MRQAIAIFVVFAALGVWQSNSVRVLADCVALQETLPQRVARSPLVFVGEVMSVDVTLLPNSFRHRVRFRIVEAFRGTEGSEQVFQFSPGLEEFKFERAQRVLVYATGKPDQYSVSICGGTRLVAEGDPEVQELRRLARQ